MFKHTFARCFELEQMQIGSKPHCKMAKLKRRLPNTQTAKSHFVIRPKAGGAHDTTK